ncbi:MAG: lysophospholipid acyltransferase family protein [Acidobacteriota bacterium]
MKNTEMAEVKNKRSSVDEKNGNADATTVAPESVRANSSPRRRRARDKFSSTNEVEFHRRLYAFADLSKYSWRARLNIYLADWFFYLLIRLLCPTLRWETRGMEHLKAIYASGHRAIFTFWHSCIFSGTWFWRNRKIVVMSSTSKDGEFTSRLIKRVGYGSSRGSATRGAGRSLAEMSECLARGIDVAFPIDGPKGPAYVAKPGAVTLARHTGAAIFLFHHVVKDYWELPSWDRLQIPKPFTRAITLIAEPIYVSRQASVEEVEAKQRAVQATLDELRLQGESWRNGR